MAERPNILLILTDQQRFDTIAALGNARIRTPALDRLCRRGVAFTSAYTPAPVCVPARCSLHYGPYPMRTGCYEHGYAMPTARPSVADVLTEAGYRTHAAGKCHFTPDKFALRGFQSRDVQEEVPARDSDDYTRLLEAEGWGELPEPHGVRGDMYYVPQVSPLPPRLHPTRWVGDRTVAFIERQAAADDGPWFLQSSYIHPHPPFAPPWPWHKLYRSTELPRPHVPAAWRELLTYVNRRQNRYKYRDRGIDERLVQCMKAHYYACISFVDAQIGRTLDALEQSGQLDRTLIVFASDHGELLGDFNCFGKRSMHDACARVPLLAALPGRFEGGRRCDTPASLIDLAPTMLAAADAEAGAMGADGVDLATLADGSSGRDAVHVQYRPAGEGVYTTVTGAWKYTYSAPDQKEFLFDRAPASPETHSAAGDHPEVVHRLRSRTIEWLRAGGEDDAIDGDRWKVYPKLEVPTDPDAGLIMQDRPGFTLDLPGYSSPEDPAA